MNLDCWPVDTIFLKPITRNVYLHLLNVMNWQLRLDKLWGKRWSTMWWSFILKMLWSLGIITLEKCFLWKLFMGVLPTTSKLESFTFASSFSKGCAVDTRTSLHLF